MQCFGGSDLSSPMSFVNVFRIYWQFFSFTKTPALEVRESIKIT